MELYPVTAPASRNLPKITEYTESGKYPMMDAIPITVPVIARGIPSSLMVANMIPYIITAKNAGMSVYMAAAVLLIPFGKTMHPA